MRLRFGCQRLNAYQKALNLIEMSLTIRFLSFYAFFIFEVKVLNITFLNFFKSKRSHFIYLNRELMSKSKYQVERKQIR